MLVLSIGSSGTVTFADIPPRDEKNRVYIIRAVGRTADGVRTVIRRKIRVGKATQSLLYSIITF